MKREFVKLDVVKFNLEKGWNLVYYALNKYWTDNDECLYSTIIVALNVF